VTTTIGRRTTLRAGTENDYERTHATIPVEVASALQASGVVSWRIWRDGRFLFHAVETSSTYDEMIEAITSLGPVNVEWDDLVGSLLESTPGSDVILKQVWSLTG
jgi:L-rhamnose mutarotase